MIDDVLAKLAPLASKHFGPCRNDILYFLTLAKAESARLLDKEL